MPNVAVVVLDTLRLDAFRRAFEGLPGRRFTRAYSTSHWTIPVHGSLFTGRYASEVGVHGGSPTLDWPGDVLPERLGAAGYTTRLFTANPQLHQYDGWDRGFDQALGYWSLDAWHPDSFDWGACFDDLDATGYRRYLAAIGRCLRADCSVPRSLREGYGLYTRSDADGGARSVLDRVRGTEFGDEEFLFVNLMEAHTPYHPAEPGGDPVTVVAADAFTDEPLDLDRARRAYRRSVDYLAETYWELFAELSEAFDYVVTLSDHGELFGEHGMVNHSIGLYPELIRVPLVVWGPDVDGVDDRPASLLDVHRTIAELAGVDVDSRGRDLLAPPDPTDRLVEYHGPLPFHESQFERKGVPAAEYRRRSAPLNGVVTRDGEYAYETHTEGIQTVGQFDGDPGARIDAAAADLDRREVSGGADVPEDVRERLADLGYG